MLYEVELFQSTITKYGHQLIETCPVMRPLLGVAERWIDPYKALAGTLSILGHDYSVVGDKIVSMDPGVLCCFDSAQIVVTGRRFSTWCCKRQIINCYRTDLDLIPAARDFLRFWTIAGTRPNVMRVRLEDLVGNTAVTCQRIADFTGLDDVASISEWWEMIGSWRDDEFKRLLLRWPDVHPSSRRAPITLDTKSTPNDHPFWVAIEPILQWYDRDSDERIALHDAETDLKIIASLEKFSPLPLVEAFESIESTSAIRELKTVTHTAQN